MCSCLCSQRMFKFYYGIIFVIASIYCHYLAHTRTYFFHKHTFFGFFSDHSMIQFTCIVLKHIFQLNMICMCQIRVLEKNGIHTHTVADVTGEFFTTHSIWGPFEAMIPFVVVVDVNDWLTSLSHFSFWNTFEFGQITRCFYIKKILFELIEKSPRQQRCSFRKYIILSHAKCLRRQ